MIVWVVKDNVSYIREYKFKSYLKIYQNQTFNLGFILLGMIGFVLKKWFDSSKISHYKKKIQVFCVIFFSFSFSILKGKIDKSTIIDFKKYIICTILLDRLIYIF